MSTIDRVSRVPGGPLQAELRSVDPAGPGRSAGRRLVEDLRSVLTAMAAAPDLVAQLIDTEVAELAECGIALTRAGEALAVAATAEALDRGLTETSLSANTAQWVRSRAAGVEPGQARRVADVAERIAGRSGLVREGPTLAQVRADAEAWAADGSGGEECGGDADSDDVARLIEADPSGRLLLGEAVASGVVNVRAAHAALREVPRIRRLIPSAPDAEVLSWFLALGDDATDRDRRRLTRQIVARFDPDQLCQEETTEQAREHLTLHELPCGMVRLIAELSKGHAALIKQAIGKLSAPQPRPCEHPEVGETPTRDERPVGKRRADALMELVSQGVAHLPGAGRGSITGNTKVVVTVDLADLRSALGGGQFRGTGFTPLGDILDVTTIRQFACAAGIIPVVLGERGEPVDVGREERLFTGRLRTAVVLRDRECTFPGCDRPPDWCQVHHLVPWWAGGPTTRDNGALLCERHHTVVHRDGLVGQVSDDRVVWDLTPGRLHQWPRAG